LCGGVISSAAVLTLNQNVTVSSGPSNQTVCAGASVNFNVSASGTGLAYQWYKGSSALAGKTSSSLTLSSVTPGSAGSYSVVVSGTCGNVTNSASLTVNQGIVVTSPPMSLTNCAGTTASFSVTATGTGLSYQWY